jgi:hypothetical protein
MIKSSGTQMCVLGHERRLTRTPTFIPRLITGDKSWIYGYDPETKQQLSQWKSPQSPRAKKGMGGPEFNKEHAHCFFFDVKGTVHREFLPPVRSTVTFTMTF